MSTQRTAPPTVYIARMLNGFQGVDYRVGDILPAEVWQSVPHRKRMLLERNGWVTIHPINPAIELAARRDPIWATLDGADGG
jgi:hypothetical protein